MRGEKVLIVSVVILFSQNLTNSSFSVKCHNEYTPPSYYAQLCAHSTDGGSLSRCPSIRRRHCFIYEHRAFAVDEFLRIFLSPEGSVVVAAAPTEDRIGTRLNDARSATWLR